MGDFVLAVSGCLLILGGLASFACFLGVVDGFDWFGWLWAVLGGCVFITNDVILIKTSA